MENVQYVVLYLTKKAGETGPAAAVSRPMDKLKARQFLHEQNDCGEIHAADRKDPQSKRLLAKCRPFLISKFHSRFMQERPLSGNVSPASRAGNPETIPFRRIEEIMGLSPTPEQERARKEEEIRRQHRAFRKTGIYRDRTEDEMVAILLDGKAAGDAGKKSTKAAPAAKVKDIAEINLETDMPPVEEAMKLLDFALMNIDRSGYAALKIVHGFGSTGKGGKIRLAVHKRLALLKEEKRIRDYICGEDFYIFKDSGVNTKLLSLFDDLPQLRKYYDCGDSLNPGVSFIIF